MKNNKIIKFDEFISLSTQEVKNIKLCIEHLIAR